MFVAFSHPHLHRPHLAGEAVPVHCAHRAGLHSVLDPVYRSRRRSHSLRVDRGDHANASRLTAQDGRVQRDDLIDADTATAYGSPQKGLSSILLGDESGRVRCRQLATVRPLKGAHDRRALTQGLSVPCARKSPCKPDSLRLGHARPVRAHRTPAILDPIRPTRSKSGPSPLRSCVPMRRGQERPAHQVARLAGVDHDVESGSAISRSSSSRHQPLGRFQDADECLLQYICRRAG